MGVVTVHTIWLLVWRLSVHPSEAETFATHDIGQQATNIFNIEGHSM